MNLSEMRDRTKLYLDDTANDRFTDAQVTGLINAAKDEVQKSIDEADEGFFSAVQTYSVVPCETSLEFELVEDFKKLILAEGLYAGIDPVPAIIVPLSERHRMHDLSTGGEPVIYLRGTKIGVVEPTFDYTLRVWYTRRLPDLVGDTDETQIPAEYHNLLCLYAARLGLISEHAQVPPDLDKEFEQEMNRMSAHIEARQLQSPRTVRYVEE
jgi:hypothetical protein